MKLLGKEKYKENFMEIENLSEQELLLVAKTDEMAVEKLLVDYKPLVCKIARQYFLIGGDIDDLVQEGMIGLYKAIRTYDKKKNTKFITFATLCIKRQMQTAVRKSTSQKSSLYLELFNDDMIDLIDTISEKENPEEKVISKQKYEYINSEIKAKLSDFEIAVLKSYLQGNSYDEIAKQFDVSKKSVDNALFRIRSKLIHLLDDSKY